ncbi:VOC family protein [Streptomyces hydrogenans]|uniref:VOC family protein n=1 Tax=Streptomyces TaxID=1883 RepID=UPI00203061BF|nr:VOC family protein [Streptomyces sp. G2]MCM1949460.1 VOC family protein [Streptomyces sp. G2]
MSAIGTLNTAHIGINVTDLDRSLGFYGDVLGFDVIGSGDADGRRYAFLGQDGKLAVTLWQQAEGGYDAHRAGLHHLAFEAESIEKVREAEAVLKARGVTFAYDGVVAHREGAASGGIFFHDPDGTRLEISVAQGAEESPAPNATAPTCGFF